MTEVKYFHRPRPAPRDNDGLGVGEAGGDGAGQHGGPLSLPGPGR